VSKERSFIASSRAVLTVATRRLHSEPLPDGRELDEMEIFELSYDNYYLLCPLESNAGKSPRVLASSAKRTMPFGWSKILAGCL